MDITILGHVCIDNNVSEHTTYTIAGSPAMFMDKVFNKFPGVTTHIIAPYGTDFLPYVKEINIYPDKPISDWTLIYENNSQKNIRTQKAFNRENAKPLPLDDKLRTIISKSDVLFFAPLTPDFTAQYVLDIVKYTKLNALKILIPQGYYRSYNHENNVIPREFKESQTLLPLFDFVIVSEQDHAMMGEIIKRWARITNVVMTRGDQGSVYLHKNDSVVTTVDPVKPEDIVDSVGSGDIFSASFGYKYYLTKDIRKSLKFANEIARQCLFYPANNLSFILPI
ncbi:hypothetical protein COY90_00080 [Candidatus Roizmanbacteria bacterium CG_4_10_14_0_8_um_filter_39_9]|uniref:Carbohydrate kinase PfkB domain-containing protein n=1 Tax=Candidatus Roizmanbacteria bacterium CG_4_10_14_0_8_um_filter_39_9 TaxID=1974829 RepID=A0A2M7QF58_9BACT|nr:MAG: hypothetical protein COY90_00080 [Candidatus Roizmanbacteria bacterium CG_4_10_14_0_8_um_filter_39_9]